MYKYIVSLKSISKLDLVGRFHLQVIGAAALGLVCSYLDVEMLRSMTGNINKIFVGMLQLISLPLIFLSIVSTVGQMKPKTLKLVGGSTLKYTLLTTGLAAIVALILFRIGDPAGSQTLATDLPAIDPGLPRSSGFWQYVDKVIPKNILQPFLDNNVLGVLFLAILTCVALIQLPQESRQQLQGMLSSCFALVQQITQIILKLVPIAVFGFTLQFVHELNHGLETSAILTYLMVVIMANLLQAGFVLPTLLMLKRLNPARLLAEMWPALTMAFFCKSSTAVIPLSVECASRDPEVDHKVAKLTFPMCATVNMNACAGFILITVLFVSQMNGIAYGLPMQLVWVLIAMLGAAGNAAVPMGCYFMASSFLAATSVPLTLLGVILPLYSLLDMLETAINVWSDACVTKCVSQEHRIGESNVADFQES